MKWGFRIPIFCLNSRVTMNLCKVCVKRLIIHLLENSQKNYLSAMNASNFPFLFPSHSKRLPICRETAKTFTFSKRMSIWIFQTEWKIMSSLCVLCPFFHSKCFLRKTYQLTSFFWIFSCCWVHIVIWNSRAPRFHFTSTNMAIKKDKLENTCITLAKKHDVLLNWDWLWPKYPSLYACVRFATIFEMHRRFCVWH